MSKKPTTKKVWVNLGCGNHLLPSTKAVRWINIDKYCPLPESEAETLEADIRSIPLASESVDYILCDNVLEHLPMSDVPTVLHEIRRILKPGGQAVLIVPDFKSAAQQWLAVDHDAAFNPYFYLYLSEVIYGNQAHEGEYHKTPFCAGYFNHVLRMVGLKKFELVIYPTFSEVPTYLGINAKPGTLCRNAQLVAVVTKEV